MKLNQLCRESMSQQKKGYAEVNASAPLTTLLQAFYFSLQSYNLPFSLIVLTSLYIPPSFHLSLVESTSTVV